MDESRNARGIGEFGINKFVKGTSVFSLDKFEFTVGFVGEDS